MVRTATKKKADGMHEIRCTKCDRLLIRASLCSGEVKCRCGKVIKINFFSQKALTEAFYRTTIKAN